MEVSSKQKNKRRKTRKFRDEIRKRLRSDIKNNVNRKNEGILQLNDVKINANNDQITSYNIKRYANNAQINNITRYANNEQITSNRLTLALFNKTVISETITRPKIGIGKKVDNKVNNHLSGEKINHNSKYIILSCESSNLEMKSPKCLMDFSSSIHVDVNTISEGTALFSPSKPTTDKEDCKSQISPEVYDTISSCSSLERPTNCLYEKFMNGLPKYLKEIFPAVREDSVVNKNTVFLKQHYLRTCQPNTENICSKLFTERGIHGSKHNRDSIIQNPMDYIQMGLSWQLSVKNKKNTLVSSSSSSSLSQFELNSSNMFIQDSPEYVYFPHKLNQ